MNTIKIAVTKMKFTEFCDIKKYKNPASKQLVVRHYTLNGSRLVIDEEKE